MQKVDVKKEIDALLSHCSDVEHYIGVAMMPSSTGKGVSRAAFARLVFLEDGQLKPWPPELVYRVAVELGTGVTMFTICPPGDFLHPMIATEMEPSIQNFIDAAERSHFFAIEVLMPSRRLVALVKDGKVTHTSENPLTRADFDRIRSSYHETTPQVPG